MYLLAKTIAAAGIDFPQPKGIMLAGENIFDWQVAKLEEVFPKAALFAHYGCAEQVVMAGWCEHNHTYHVLPQYSLVELDPATHEVVGTNLHNSVNGFIRYRLTDTAQELLPPGCPDCGRPYARLAQLDGRREDYLFSPERGWIPPAPVTNPLKGLQAIREIQFYQVEPSRITVRYSLPEEAGRPARPADGKAAGGKRFAAVVWRRDPHHVGTGRRIHTRRVRQIPIYHLRIAAGAMTQPNFER